MEKTIKENIKRDVQYKLSVSEIRHAIADYVYESTKEEGYRKQYINFKYNRKKKICGVEVRLRYDIKNEIENGDVPMCCGFYMYCIATHLESDTREMYDVYKCSICKAKKEIMRENKNV